MVTLQTLFGAWQTGVPAAADLLTALACYSIAASLAYFIYRRPDTRGRVALGLLMTGLVLAGSASLIDGFLFPEPLGGWQSALTLLAGGALAAAALGLWPLVLQALRLPDAGTLSAQASQLEAELAASRAAEAASVQRLSDLQRELARSGEELARCQDSLERYAYSVSHDLQEPLRMMVGFSQLLQRRCGHELSDQAREFVDMSAASAQRMSAMLGDLLTLSRVDGAEIAEESIDLNEVFKQASHRMAVKIAGSGAVVSVDPLPQVIGDKALLSQLFENLLDNAVKFQGDVSPRVRVSAERKGADWELAVSDNGIGLDATKFADRIFEPFQRLHTQTEYPGTGMGLTIARRIVERHGGRLWVESTPGEGAVFRFSLRAEQPLSGAGSARSTGAGKGSSRPAPAPD